jgi:hypothetical protein
VGSTRRQTLLAAAAGFAGAGVIVLVVATQLGSNGSSTQTTSPQAQSRAPGTDVAGLRVTRLIAAAVAQQTEQRLLTATFFRSFFASLSAAAGYLGVSWPSLQARLEHGKSLAELARDAGKSRDGLVKTMLAAHRHYLDATLASHQLTPAQEQVLLVDAEPWMEGVVDGTGSNKGFGSLLDRPFTFAGQVVAPGANGAPARVP